MKRRLTAGVTIAALLGATSIADAHHPEITVNPGCIQNAQASVFVTATAWQTGDPAHRVNNDIGIDVWNGSQWVNASNGAFTLNVSSFTRALTLPADVTPVTARIRAIARVPWGPNGEFGSVGEWRETTVTVNRPCLTVDPVPSTVPPTFPPTTAPDPKLPPFTTTPTTVPPVSLVPPAVELPASPPASVVVTTPRFTG